MLLRKGVICNAADELDVYLYKVVLVAGREDRPAQSGYDYWIYIYYWLLKKVTVTDYLVQVLEACVKHV